VAKETEAEQGTEEGASEGAEGAGASKKKKLILIGAAAALFLVAGGGGWYFFSGGKKKDDVASEAAVKAKPSIFFDLPDLTVNLGNSERQLYLRVKVSLELVDAQMLAQVQPILPRVADAFQTYMRELRPSDIEGTAGIYRLKEELLRRVNSAVYPARVESVLFKEFVVQ
jgi:flagellar protein FliL